MTGLTTGRADGEQLARHMQREAKAHALIDAIIQFDRDERLSLLETLLEGMRAGAPLPAFGAIWAEANSWADDASPQERKAWCAACWSRMTAKDQAAFREFIEDARAA